MIRPSVDALHDHVESRAAGRPPRARLLVASPVTEGDSRTGSTRRTPSPLADFDSAFDTQLGSPCAHTAPRCLGLPPHVDADTYWNHRTRTRRPRVGPSCSWAAAGVSDWLVDTGFAAGTAELAELMSEVSGGTHTRSVTARDARRARGATRREDYAAAFEELLHTRAAERSPRPSRYSPIAVDSSVTCPIRRRHYVRRGRRPVARRGRHPPHRSGVAALRPPSGPPRSASHCSFMSASATGTAICPPPIRFTSCDFLCAAGDTPIMLLHCYPFEREAGYLAQAFNNVYLDGGLSINYLGARSRDFIGRLLELAPFRKILYSSDGSARQNCTISEHGCGATESGTYWRSSSEPASGPKATPCVWSTSSAPRMRAAFTGWTDSRPGAGRASRLGRRIEPTSWIAFTVMRAPRWGTRITPLTRWRSPAAVVVASSTRRSTSRSTTAFRRARTSRRGTVGCRHRTAATSSGLSVAPSMRSGSNRSGSGYRSALAMDQPDSRGHHHPGGQPVAGDVGRLGQDRGRRRTPPAGCGAPPCPPHPGTRRPLRRPPRSACAAATALRSTSGCRVSRSSAHDNAVAVVSCPATSSVINWSRSSTSDIAAVRVGRTDQHGQRVRALGQVGIGSPLGDLGVQQAIGLGDARRTLRHGRQPLQPRGRRSRASASALDD